MFVLSGDYKDIGRHWLDEHADTAYTSLCRLNFPYFRGISPPLDSINLSAVTTGELSFERVYTRLVGGGLSAGPSAVEGELWGDVLAWQRQARDVLAEGAAQGFETKVTDCCDSLLL